MADLQGQAPWQGPADWIPRLQGPVLSCWLEQFPAVALLGPRQVGKTTLALQLAASTPSLYLDLEASAQDLLWIHGGLPGSVLAASDQASCEWRRQFIRTYLERDIPQLGPRVPSETLRRF